MSKVLTSHRGGVFAAPGLTYEKWCELAGVVVERTRLTDLDKARCLRDLCRNHPGYAAIGLGPDVQGWVTERPEVMSFLRGNKP
jgi:hypothetical protein